MVRNYIPGVSCLTRIISRNCQMPVISVPRESHRLQSIIIQVKDIAFIGRDEADFCKNYCKSFVKFLFNGTKSFSQSDRTTYVIKAIMNRCYINIVAGFQRTPRGMVCLAAINLSPSRGKNWRWLAHYIITVIIMSPRRSVCG